MSFRWIVLLLFLFVGHTAWSQLSEAMQDLLKQDDLTALQKIALTDEEIVLLTHQSIQAGANTIATYLVKKMPDPNVLSAEGLPALHLAVLQEEEKLIKLLLEQGADPNLRAKDNLGTTALMMATARPQSEIFALLVDQGADINAIDLQGDPVVNWAAYYGHEAALRTLVDQKVDLSISSKHGNAADVLLRLWYPDQYLRVFDGTVLAQSIPKDHKKLHEAIEKDQATELQKLLQKGTSPNAADAYGSSPLHRAAARGYLELAKILIDKGATVNSYNRAGQTPLTLAARFGHTELAQMLLDQGADINAADQQYGLTALIGSAVGGHLDMVKLLVQSGAVVDHQDVINSSAALHWALFRKHPTVAAYLLDQGADYRAKVLGGDYDFLALAESYDQQELIDKVRSFQEKQAEILGSYTTTNIQYIYTDTTYLVDEPAPGIFVAAPARYVVLYHPSSKIRAAFTDFSNPSCEDLRAAYQNLIFNTGSYHVTDQWLIAHPDIARVPGFEGAKQIYEYEQKDDQLILTMFDETYPDGTKPSWYGKLRIQLTFTRE